MKNKWARNGTPFESTPRKDDDTMGINVVDSGSQGGTVNMSETMAYTTMNDMGNTLNDAEYDIHPITIKEIGKERGYERKEEIIAVEDQIATSRQKLKEIMRLRGWWKT